MHWEILGNNLSHPDSICRAKEAKSLKRGIFQGCDSGHYLGNAAAKIYFRWRVPRAHQGFCWGPQNWRQEHLWVLIKGQHKNFCTAGTLRWKRLSSVRAARSWLRSFESSTTTRATSRTVADRSMSAPPPSCASLIRFSRRFHWNFPSWKSTCEHTTFPRGNSVALRLHQACR